MSPSLSKTTLRVRLRDFDWILLIITIILVVYGIIVIYSTATAQVISGITKNQIIFASIGFMLFVVFILINYRSFKVGSIYLYIITLILLCLVLILGRQTMGAVRWLDIGFFRLQPSEFAKLFLVIILAKFFSSRQEQGGIKLLILSGLYTVVPVILVMLQPDLGTALVFISIWLSMVFISNINKIYVLVLAGIGVLMTPIAWHFLHDYQRKRILTFLNPQADPLGSGYNVIQSMIASGSGRIFGRGLGYGYQSQLKFLPIQHTDFIFAVLAEALGLVGAFVLLVLFFILLLRILKIASQASDDFGMFLSIGVFTMILFQVLINIGMNIGIMPVTGIPLPLISAGGSSLITTLVALGIVESIAIRRRKIIF